MDADLDNLCRLSSECLNLLFCEVGALILAFSSRLETLRVRGGQPGSEAIE